MFMVTGVAYTTVNTVACTSCHDAHFEQHDIGKSKIIADMSNQDVIKALIGCKKVYLISMVWVRLCWSG